MTLLEIRANARRLVDANQNDTQYPASLLDMSVNAYYDLIIHDLMREQGMWEINGESYVANLVANQSQYKLPVQASRINRIEVNYSGTDEGWFVAWTFDMRQTNIPLSNTNPIIGGPAVDFRGNSIFLYRAPTSNVTAGIRLFVDGRPALLEESTDEPIFARGFHDILAIGAALDYALTKKKELISVLQARYDTRKDELFKFVRSRLNTANVVIRPYINSLNCQ